MNSRTRAVLSPDGKHYILNGEKMWITNAHFADLFTVFAKIDGEKFTAFLVEKDFPGFSVGAEEKKMGIRGSSTAPLILNDCKVPVENVLGEIGKGHIIAFNILNVGRFKLGASCVGGARTSLQHAIAYAKERKAFGKSIADFGLIREKLAQMAARHLRRRVDGLPHRRHDGHRARRHRATIPKTIRKAIEEYAVECSIIKVAGLGDARHGGRRDRADLRRLRLRRRVSGGARLSRLAREPHLRRHQRNQSPHHHRMAAEARHERTACAAARHQEDDGRGDGRPVRPTNWKARWPPSASWWRTPRSWPCWWPERLRRSTCRSWPISRRSWAPSPTW